MRDREGNEIKLKDIPNPHILILGQSGQGKTFLSCRELEQCYESGEKALVLDYSSSYTNREMEKNGFKYMDKVLVFRPQKEPFRWNCNYLDEEKFCANLCEVLSESLEIRSYIQKKLLKKAVTFCIKEKSQWSVSQLHKVLEEMLEYHLELGKNEEARNLDLLLTRLEPFLGITKFYIKNSHTTTRDSVSITIMQISDFSGVEKKFLTSMILGLLWKEREHEECKKHCDALFIDEVQHAPLFEESALGNMLRQGRKTELRVVMATQFISSYDKDKQMTLLQAGHYILFRPTPKEMEDVAKLIESENVMIWKRVLGKLGIGEAVVTGCYAINNQEKTLETPIICKAELRR